MRSWGRDRLFATILAAIGSALSGPSSAAAHPGQHLDLRISIGDEEVVYTVLISADLSRELIPGENYKVLYSQDDDEFHFLDPEQEQRARQAYEEFFREKSPLTIDGVSVKPILKALHLVPDPLALQGRTKVPPDVRVILAYPTKGGPKCVSMVWKLYAQDPSRAAFGLSPVVELVAELDAYDENKIIMFTEQEPEVVWHAPGKPAKRQVTPVVVTAEPPKTPIPVASLAILLTWGAGLLILRFWRFWQPARRQALVVSLIALAGASCCYDLLVVEVVTPWVETVKLPDAGDAVNIFTSLHRNVYRAFDYKTENDIYDVLAQSVDGTLLDQVYNEVYQSLILRDQGGAVARVQSVDILDSEVVSSGILTNTNEAAFGVRSRWRVRGAVYHWGHVHSRTNEYKALYTVAQRGDNWKITAVDVLEQRRIVMKGDDPPLLLPGLPEESQP